MYNDGRKITSSLKFGKDRLIKVIIIVLLLIIMSFANSGYLISKISLYFIFIFTIITLPLLRGRINLKYKGILKSGIVLVIYILLIIMFNFENYKSLYNGLLYAASILFFLSLISMSIREETLILLIKYISKASQILILMNIFLRILNIGFNWVSSSSFIFLFLYFIYIDKSTGKNRKIIFTVLWIVNLVVNGERTFILIIPILLIFILLWEKISIGRKRYNIIFSVIILLLFLLPIGYILLAWSNYSYALNEFAIKYTDSRFFSGRDVIWSNLLNYYVNHNILFGGGHHISPNYVYNAELSSHNTYISVLIRTGILGSLLFFNFLRSIWKTYYSNKSKVSIKLSAVFFVVILLKQSSELSLIGNNISVTVLSWIVIAFGLLLSNSYSKVNQSDKED